jgi:nucleotide-binding universal stress UspA family protein
MTEANAPRTRTIVVGIDGSPNSVAALKWAIEEAALRDDTVRALHCWTYPVGYGIEMAGVPSMAPDVLEKSALVMAEETVAAARKQLGMADGAGPAIVSVARHGAPASELIEESNTADLVVVGSRGHGGFVGLLLGSVATQTVNHSHCPVVVVPSV